MWESSTILQVAYLNADGRGVSVEAMERCGEKNSLAVGVGTTDGICAHKRLPMRIETVPHFVGMQHDSSGIRPKR